MLEKADHLPLPTEVLDQHIAILGKTGSGKSNAAKVIVEWLLDRGERVCILDPTNTWWGMRLSASGRDASPYPIAIFGGDRADLVIGAAHGAAVAEAIGTSNSPAIIATRQMSVRARTGFFADFAETLLQVNRGVLHLVLDEAHVFMPQGKVPDPLSGRMLHAANELVSLGRGIGLRIILISQRPAKIHKDSLSQVETMIALRFIAPQDTDAIEDWLKKWVRRQRGAAQGEEIIASLPSLHTGDAWIWSPEIGVLQREHFPLARTFDSGTPQAAQRSPALAAIDIDALRGRLETVEADIKANDPAALRAEIARLRSGAAAAEPADLEAVRRETYFHGYENGRVAALAEREPELERMRGYLASLAGVLDRIGENGAVLADAARQASMAALGASKGDIADAATVLDAAEQTAPADSTRVGRGARVDPPSKPDELAAFGGVAPGFPPSPIPRAPAPRPRRGAAGNGGFSIKAAGAAARIAALPVAARRMLGVLVQRAPARLTWTQVATLAALKARGGSFNTARRMLRDAGYVTEQGSHVSASDAAIADSGLEPTGAHSTGAEVLAMWCDKLPAPAPAMLRRLAVVPDAETTAAELAAALDLQPRGGFWNKGLALLRNNKLVEIRSGVVRLAAELR